ncbi:MAG: asparagine--tRNA ligase, partial [Clostridia bacterium]|nr:asparagine--tRNA ligase [Clostridia bacterium]
MVDITIQTLKSKKDFYIGKTVQVCGWVKNFRESKTTSFLEINDGSTFKPLQIVIQKEENKINAETLNRVMHLGVAVVVSGVAVSAYHNPDDAEINAEKINVLGDCAADYPIQKKKTSL